MSRGITASEADAILTRCDFADIVKRSMVGAVRRELVVLAEKAVQKRLSHSLAKLAIRQRPKAPVWARHHMRRVAKEV